MQKHKIIPSLAKLFRLNVSFLSLCLLCLNSCSADKKPTSAEVSYIKAFKKLKAKDYLTASEDFEKINDEFPLSKWAIKAQVMAAYGFYKEGKYEDVIRISQDFARNNPSSPDSAYVQYIKALSYYNQMSDTKRAQDNAILAYGAFRELITRFRGSIYSADSEEKLAIASEYIAGAKIENGNYQIKKGNYVGAIKNFQDVINNRSPEKQEQEAYFKMFEIYKKLGLNQIAEQYLKTLKQKYPNKVYIKP